MPWKYSAVRNMTTLQEAVLPSHCLSGFREVQQEREDNFL